MNSIIRYLKIYKYKHIFLKYVFKKNVTRNFIKISLFKNFGSLNVFKFFRMKKYINFVISFFSFEIFYSTFVFKGCSNTICFKSNDFLKIIKASPGESIFFVYEDKRFLDLFYSINIQKKYMGRYRFLNRYFGSHFKLLELLEIYGHSHFFFISFFSMFLFLFVRFLFLIFYEFILLFYNFILILNGFIQAVGKKVS